MSTGDTAAPAKPKATSKRKATTKRKSKGAATKTDAASTETVRDADAAHAEFIAQFPTTDPDAVEAEATPVSDVTTETDDSETAQDPSEASVSADDKAEPETEAAVSETAEAVEAEVDVSTDPVDGEVEKESADNDVVEQATAAADVRGSEDDEAGVVDAASGAVAATPEADSAEGTETADTEADTEADAESDVDVTTPEVDAEDIAATPAPEPAVPTAAALDPDVDGTDDPDEALDDDDASSWVRPYVWTGGRTETTMDFAIETLVSARQQVAGADEALRDEHRRVLELCDEPRSVTEIAALLSVPLGVAKTLLGAMVEEDLVVVHRTNGSAAGPDLALMERVLRGLKKL